MSLREQEDKVTDVVGVLKSIDESIKTLLKYKNEACINNDEVDCLLVGITESISELGVGSKEEERRQAIEKAIHEAGGTDIAERVIQNRLRIAELGAELSCLMEKNIQSKIEDTKDSELKVLENKLGSLIHENRYR